MIVSVADRRERNQASVSTCRSIGDAFKGWHKNWAFSTPAAPLPFSLWLLALPQILPLLLPRLALFDAFTNTHWRLVPVALFEDFFSLSLALLPSLSTLLTSSVALLIYIFASLVSLCHCHRVFFPAPKKMTFSTRVKTRLGQCEASNPAVSLSKQFIFHSAN